MIVEVASLATSGLVAIGLIVTWVHNGRTQAERDIDIAEKQTQRDQVLASNQKTILRRLDDEDTGLSALNNKIQSFNLHCAKTSTGLNGRITATEREIKELKHQP